MNIPPASLEKRKLMERVVDRILAAKQRKDGADVSALEREIDGLVYALYQPMPGLRQAGGLTKDEIKIIEEAGK